MSEQPDIVIIGSGMGGATLAAGLAGSGARIVILERGEAIVDTPQARDARAIFIDKHFRTTEHWQVGKRRVRPSQYYCVGRNTVRRTYKRAMKSTGEISMAPPRAGFREFSTRDRREQASRRSFSIAVAREAGPTGPVCPVPFAGRQARSMSKRPD